MRPVSMVVLTSFMALASACGFDKGSSSSSQGGSPERINGMTFADEASLPTCDESTEGFLVYVTSLSLFKTCSSGVWNSIDLTGPKGDKGQAGESGTNDFAAAISVYKKYRRSVFRATLTCSGCSGSTNGTVKSLGSAFLCGTNEVCTNRHVAACDLNCSTFDSLALQALDDTDSLNSGTTITAPFVTITDDANIRLGGSSLDLAKVTVTNVPSGIIPIPLATTAAKGNITAITSMLSMSFPLGFLDLYVDVGAVNATYIGECGGDSEYGCPKNSYDFSTTNDTDHGSSGSPLIDIATGKVVGVTSAGTDNENANYTWAIDASKFSEIP